MDLTFARYDLSGNQILDPRQTVFLGNTTWAQRPPASGVPVGSEIVVTDVPAGGRSRWYSDGSYWRPANGSVALGRASGTLAVPVVAALALAAASNIFFVLPTNILIPAGLVIPGSSLRARATMVHHGSAGTVTARILIGTAPNSAFVNVQAASLAASEGSFVVLEGDVDIRTLATQVNHAFIATNTPTATAANMQDLAIDFTVAQYVVFGVLSGSSGVSSDTLDLISYEVIYKA
jgi:hypothetical protein